MNTPSTAVKLRLPRLPAHTVLNPLLVYALRTTNRLTSAKAIAHHIGCHVSTITKARRGATWRFVARPTPTTPTEAQHAIG